MKNINLVLLVIVVLLGSCNLFLDVVNTIDGSSGDIEDTKANQPDSSDDGTQLTATPGITPVPTAEPSEEPTDQGLPTPSEVPTPVPTGLPTPTPQA